MAFVGVGLIGGIKSLVGSFKTSPSLLNITGVERILTRLHSHTTLSTKRKIPPPPGQPKEKYDVDFRINGGLHGWTDWAMKKDHRKRESVVRWGCERNLVNTIRKNRILPRELREIADNEIKIIPRESSYIVPIKRCCVSSRGRGVVIRWRLSRHFFRHLADYNKLSGVQRGIW